MNNVSVVIGRFQVPALHESHLELIGRAAYLNKRLLILVGTRATPPTANNPLSFELRQKMIAKSFPEAVILPLADCRGNEEWTKKIDNIIHEVFGDVNATIYVGVDSDVAKCYLGKHKINNTFPRNANISGTSIRENIVANPIHSDAFRAGVIYGMQKLPHRTYTTVDIAMYQINPNTSPTGRFVLLAKKPNENLWRLPGGFVDATDTSFENAVMRELREETGLGSEGKPEYIGNYMIDDWRVRGQQNVNHRTVLYAIQYCYGRPVAQDDISALAWHNVRTLSLDSIVPEHKELVKATIDFILNKRS